MRYIAQATQVPNNGASNAEDFQPLTRNPQEATGTQPQTGSLQQTSGQDVLSDQNIQLVVPTGSDNGTQPDVFQSPAGMNWGFVFGVTIAVTILASFFLHRYQEKARANEAQKATPEPISEDTEPKFEAPRSPKALPKKPKKKKSKSKRKRGRN